MMEMLGFRRGVALVLVVFCWTNGTVDSD